MYKDGHHNNEVQHLFVIAKWHMKLSNSKFCIHLILSPKVVTTLAKSWLVIIIMEPNIWLEYAKLKP